MNRQRALEALQRLREAEDARWEAEKRRRMNERLSLLPDEDPAEPSTPTLDASDRMQTSTD